MDDDVIVRFRFQVDQAVKNTVARYGQWWIDADDLRQYAREMLTEYRRSGKIDQWRAKTGGDRNQMDRYALRELNCDLADEVRKIIRRKSNEVLVAGLDNVPSQAESPEDSAQWVSWPVLDMWIRWGMTIREIAEVKGVSRMTAQRMLDKEREEAKSASVT